MRLLVHCATCFQELGHPSRELAYVEFKDDALYEFTCSFGHTSITALQQQKFEILFEIGAHAILDGYYRESVSSFASSLERFYEFSIRIFLEHSTKSDKLFRSTWKTVSSQSERQLGAFLFLWATHFKETPELPPQNMITFRNEVIHKGKIPTKEEAIAYGNSVLAVLKPKINALRSKFTEEVENSPFRQILCALQKNDNHPPITTTSISTIISLINRDPTHYKKDLGDHLRSLSESRKFHIDLYNI